MKTHNKKIVGVEFSSTLNHIHHRAESRVHIMTFIVMALPLQKNILLNPAHPLIL